MVLSIQQQIYLKNAGILTEETLHEKKLSDEEIEKFLKHLSAEARAEWDKLENKKPHKVDDGEEEQEHLHEETEKESEPVEGKVSNDTRGKLHELLVGKHLNGGKHMEHHPDKSGDTPEEAHNKLMKTVHKNDYKKIEAKAKSAASDIKKKLEQNGHKIHSVHWTSQPNDLLRTTGIKASQKEDSSDIVVTTKKGKETKHHGVSLKVTTGKSKHIGTSNLGLHSASGKKANSLVDEHRKGILKKYPDLANRNASYRKEAMKKDPKMSEYVKKKNNELLHNLAKDYHEHLTTMPKHELVHHIRNIIHAHQTPMQKQGHGHLRHVTYAGKDENSHEHHSLDPAQHHEHILNNPHEIEVHHSGQAIHFKHKGKTFATHSFKFKSQSDPLGHAGGKGNTAGD